MACTARPWYHAQTGRWMAYVDGRKVPLAKGPKDRPTRALARQVLDDLLRQREANPAPQAGEPTVASIIELYLRSASYSIRARRERVHYLQRFAEHCGWKKVRECIPYDLTSWVDANPQWQSDWTLSQVINIVQRPFNWAARQRLIRENPFRGITHRQGEPRRPMTPEEFRRLVRATRERHSRRRPTSGARFRHFLYFPGSGLAARPHPLRLTTAA